MSEEFTKETEKLDIVKGKIKKIIEDKNVNIEKYKKEIVESKKFIWNNQSEYKDFEVTFMMNEEDFNVDIINKDIVKVYKLYRSLETPYFSRVDFESKDGKESFYIGLTGVDEDYEPIVYDWRTNVANLYYNYALGNAKYESELGEVEGEITLKRQFTIERGKLLHMYDSSIGIRDELLEQVLNNNTSDQMKNIVGTIQKEQNDIIRRPLKRNIIVEGVAGSGKTSVAMHRIAYLLYNAKDLTNKNVLIFSPSSVFSLYISNVLPELGEENVTTTTYDDLVSEITGRKAESLVEFALKFYQYKEVFNVEKTEHMLSLGYKDDIDKYLEMLFDKLKFDKKIGLKTKFLMSRELNDMKSKVPKSLNFNDKLDYLSEKICGEFNIDQVKNAPKIKGAIKKILGISKDPVKLYEEFIDHEIGEQIRYTDTMGLLYLYFEVHGYPEYGHIREIIIDEAQDYSSLQYFILKKIFRSATFTILGDPNQRINPALHYETLEVLGNMFTNHDFMKMNKAYRSSKKIIDFSNKLIPNTNSIAVRDDVHEDVEFLNGSDVKADLDSIINKYKSLGYRKIGIVTKTIEERDKLRKIFKDIDIEVIYLAKGLEYDAVIVYTDDDNMYTIDETNLIYVAATRALHALTLYNQDIIRDFVERV